MINFDLKKYQYTEIQNYNLDAVVDKFKAENKYCLAPIYDCGNCFYGKTGEERIVSMLSDEAKLYSSAINGVTAYEDDDEKRINALNILNYIKLNKPETILSVYNMFISNYKTIEAFINGIPSMFEDVLVISDNRKEYYLKTLKIRLEYLYNNFIK